jgi:hypothetical protein
MECPTAPRVILLRLRCDRYVRCSVRVGVGGVVTGASLSFPGPGAVAAAPLPPSRPPFVVFAARRLASRTALSSHAPPWPARFPPRVCPACAPVRFVTCTLAVSPACCTAVCKHSSPSRCLFALAAAASPAIFLALRRPRRPVSPRCASPSSPPLPPWGGQEFRGGYYLISRNRFNETTI